MPDCQTISLNKYMFLKSERKNRNLINIKLVDAALKSAA